MKNTKQWGNSLCTLSCAIATVVLHSTFVPNSTFAIEIEQPDQCVYTDVDLVSAPESCEFRIVNWNASGKAENWNLNKDRQVADFVIQHVSELAANVITLQEASALSLGYIEQDLPGWHCYYDMFALDDHIAICVKGTATNFNSKRLRDVSLDPDDLPQDSDPPYWWGYVQVVYEGVLITSVHTRLFWKEEHVTELHEDVKAGIIAGDFNYINAHQNPNVSENPEAVPGPDWHQSDLDLEWTLDQFIRNDDGEIIEQKKEKVDHILTVKQPHVVWGDSCLDGRDDVPIPFQSAHRILLGRVAFQEKPSIAPEITNAQQPVEVDGNCSATVAFRIAIHDSCCLDANNLALTVTASDLEANVSLSTVAIDSIVQLGARDVEVTGHVEASSLLNCPAKIVIEAAARDCAGNPGDTVLQETSATATVIDAMKPTATPPPDVTVQCDHNVPQPNIDDVVASDNCGSVAVTHEGDVDDGQTCPRTITRTYAATDECGNSVDVFQTIVVDDTIPPQIAASNNDLYSLWPPNHKYHCFDAGQFAPVITDNCDAQPTWSFDACTSNQPDNGVGDGNTINDCVLGADAQGFCARSERTGGDRAGRRYDLNIRAKDACGNVSASTEIGNIHVPHDKARP